jgi:hypothetical protein
MAQSQARDQSRLILLTSSSQNLTNFKELILTNKIRTKSYIIEDRNEILPSQQQQQKQQQQQHHYHLHLQQQQELISNKSQGSFWIHFGCPNCNEGLVGKQAYVKAFSSYF